MSIQDYYKTNGDVDENSVKLTNSNFPTNNKSHNHKGSGERAVHFTEEVFGKYFDGTGKCHVIKRYTWRNQNKIQVQVINFGARITAIRLPDRKGAMEDIVLGFDDLAGYIYHKNFYFGATIGRTTNRILNKTFMLGKERVKLKSPNHYNGGLEGLDHQVFNTYIEGNQVIMTHVSPDMTEGYPGDLLVQVKFELTTKNEFKINIQAQTTKPTIVNLSNLLFFNLAGQHTGPDEIYRHIVTLNCNCFTQLEEGVPNGRICNVIYTPYDFQIPVCLGKVMGRQPHDGFDQNLCVNRGMTQGNCFVGRVFHPPSGRMLEVYSNQPGVQFTTANDFGSGYNLTMEEIMKRPCSTPRNSVEIPNSSELDGILKLFKKFYQNITDVVDVDRDTDYLEIRKLISTIRRSSSTMDECKKNIFKISLTPIQWEYLNCILLTSSDGEDQETCQTLRKLVNKILDDAEVQDPEGVVMKPPKQQSSISHINDYVKKLRVYEDIKQKTSRCIHEKNKIPKWYTATEQIKGKARVVYRTHGGIALQTQNYPSSINFGNFPSCVLNPGQTYEHNITYKFWIRAGNPQKWVKRNASEKKAQEGASKIKF